MTTATAPPPVQDPGGNPWTPLRVWLKERMRATLASEGEVAYRTLANEGAAWFLQAHAGTLIAYAESLLKDEAYRLAIELGHQTRSVEGKRALALQANVMLRDRFEQKARQLQIRAFSNWVETIEPGHTRLLLGLCRKEVNQALALRRRSIAAQQVDERFLSLIAARLPDDDTPVGEAFTDRELAEFQAQAYEAVLGPRPLAATAPPATTVTADPLAGDAVTGGATGPGDPPPPAA